MCYIFAEIQMAWLKTLVRPRQKQGNWFYCSCLGVCLVYTLLLAVEASVQWRIPLHRLWPLLVPSLLLLAQLLYPTLAAWVVLLSGSLGLFVVLTKVTMLQADLSGGLVRLLGSAFHWAVFLGICVGLYHYRPLRRRRAGSARLTEGW